ncbi:sensor histidine kinase [Cohnella boryungensis]|uniref:histidine kinase n=1 Tax=Cohnella boryungensis TaxID=768479 RepID=A0ABV8S9C4_9BACL
MKNNVWAVLSGRHSIRLQMVWTFVACILLASIVSISVPIGMLFDIPVSILAFLATFAVAFILLTRRTIRYMQKLSEGLTVISGGNLQYRIPVVRRDELGAIAGHINAMAEKLESLIEKERQVEKSKMELITGVSHDLRTPLTSIIGYLGLLQEKAYRDDTEYERFIGNTHNKAKQLKTLIDQLFEYTRLTQGEAELELHTIDLREMLDQMLVELQPLALDSDVVFEARIPESPLFIRLDGEKMRRAIDNLLMNAMKFSVKPGLVVVALTAQDRGVTIAVENEGAAITKEQEAHLFERFYKADDSRTGQAIEAGAGLGLAITQSIVRHHGGSVTLDHDAGRFRFAIELPREASR